MPKSLKCKRIRGALVSWFHVYWCYRPNTSIPSGFNDSKMYWSMKAWSSHSSPVHHQLLAHCYMIVWCSCVWCYNLQGEILLPVVFENPSDADLPSCIDIYRPVRQNVYAILYGDVSNGEKWHQLLFSFIYSVTNVANLSLWLRELTDSNHLLLHCY